MFIADCFKMFKSFYFCFINVLNLFFKRTKQFQSNFEVMNVHVFINCNPVKYFLDIFMNWR